MGRVKVANVPHRLSAAVSLGSAIAAAAAVAVEVYDRPPAHRLQLLEVGRQHWTVGAACSSWSGAELYVVWYGRILQDVLNLPAVRTRPVPSFRGDAGGRHLHGTVGVVHLSLDDLDGRRSRAVFLTRWQLDAPLWTVAAIGCLPPAGYAWRRRRTPRRLGRGFAVEPARPSGPENRG